MDTIESVILDGVEIQQNGIIRNSKGRLIGRLVDDVSYDSEHVCGNSIHEKATPSPIIREQIEKVLLNETGMPSPHRENATDRILTIIDTHYISKIEEEYSGLNLDNVAHGAETPCLYQKALQNISDIIKEASALLPEDRAGDNK